MTREIRYDSETPMHQEVPVTGKLQAGYDQGTQAPEGFIAPPSKPHYQSQNTLSAEFAARITAVFDIGE